MLPQPLATIVMPVYNSDRFLQEAINSILSQTLKDFEVVIVAGNSTDKSDAILENFRKKDKRINVVHQEHDGLVSALNMGCLLARGKYIARMDADDISLQERLEKQVSFMEAHPDVGVCGTWTKIIGCKSGDIWRYPSDDERIRCEMFFNSCFVHPSVVMRRDLLALFDLPYDPKFIHAEDYELWVRLSRYTRFANLPKVLLYHRLHSNNVGSMYTAEQETTADRIRHNQLLQLDITPSQEESILHRSIASRKFQADKDFVEKSEEWLRKIKQSNETLQCYPEPAFSKVLAEYWFAVCNHASSLGSWSWKIFWQSPLSKSELNPKRKMEFAVKCGIKYG